VRGFFLGFESTLIVSNNDRTEKLYYTNGVYYGPVIIENFISGSGVVVCYNRKHFISLSYTNKQIMETIINEVNLMSSLEKVLFIFWSFCVISFCLLLMGSVFIAVYDKMRRMTSNTPKSKFGQNIWRYRI
jgi:hypothetical protein